MRVEPILFKQLSVFFLERDLLMDCMLLLDAVSYTHLTLPTIYSV